MCHTSHDRYFCRAIVDDANGLAIRSAAYRGKECYVAHPATTLILLPRSSCCLAHGATSLQPRSLLLSSNRRQCEWSGLSERIISWQGVSSRAFRDIRLPPQLNALASRTASVVFLCGCSSAEARTVEQEDCGQVKSQCDIARVLKVFCTARSEYDQPARGRCVCETLRGGGAGVGDGGGRGGATFETRLSSCYHARPAATLVLLPRLSGWHRVTGSQFVVETTFRTNDASVLDQI